MLGIVPFYASLLAALYFFLSLRVIRMRRRERIALGDGENARLERAIRVHANFAEYVPLDSYWQRSWNFSSPHL